MHKSVLKSQAYFQSVDSYAYPSDLGFFYLKPTHFIAEHWWVLLWEELYYGFTIISYHHQSMRKIFHGPLFKLVAIAARILSCGWGKLGACVSLIAIHDDNGIDLDKLNVPDDKLLPWNGYDLY